MAESLRPRTDGHRDPFHAQAEAFGLSRTNMLVWRAAAFIAIPWAIAATGWGIYEVKTDPAVETVFVLVDEETRVLHTAVAGPGPSTSRRRRTWRANGSGTCEIVR